ncbi:MAG: alpha/beta hydrolase [Frankiales bacterium]|nr:alpha/beta hydrolase [Frankiales bacterium]
MSMTRRRALGVFGAVGASIAGLGATVRSLGSPAPRPKIAAGTGRSIEAYGPLAPQSGEWWVPPGAGAGLLRTVVLIHGGYWRDGFGPKLEDAVAADLAARGFLVWNVDYRPSSAPWPSTLGDAALAFDHTAKGQYAGRVDRDRLAVVGHSAGGHLALWLASRGRVPAGGPGSAPTLPPPTLAIGQAPVAGLAEGALLGLGGGAVQALLGGSPTDVPQRYAAADPISLLPTGVRSMLLHSEADQLVPISQSEGYATAASAAGDDCRLVRVPGDHFAHLDPATPAVAALREALGALS